MTDGNGEPLEELGALSRRIRKREADRRYYERHKQKILAKRRARYLRDKEILRRTLEESDGTTDDQER